MMTSNRSYPIDWPNSSVADTSDGRGGGGGADGSGAQHELHEDFLTVLLVLFCVFTVFGNALVIVAVWRCRCLHTITNFFVVSLATADLLVGLVVMPLDVLAKRWFFNRDLCDLWHSLDVLFSTASILHLCLISMDRYMAIHDPIVYPRRMTMKTAVVAIVFAWLGACLISFPAIAWWRAVSHEDQDDVQLLPFQNSTTSDERQTWLSHTITCQFTDDPAYIIISSVISFYGPLVIMLFTYQRIYTTAVEQKRSLRLGTKQVSTANGGDETTELTLRIHRGGGGGASSENVRSNDVSFSRRLARLAKERKAAKTLGIVMGVFVLCWLPFFVVNIIVGVCSVSCFGDRVFTVISVVTWLGWINSGMNPVIYACWSRDFRRSFVSILCISGCCSRYDRQRRRRRHSVIAVRRSSTTKTASNVTNRLSGVVECQMADSSHSEAVATLT